MLFIYLLSKTGKAFNSIFFDSLTLVRLALYFPKCYSSFKRKDIDLLVLSLSPSLTLNVLTYSLSLGNIKANVLITLPKYPIKYLELVFVLINIEITMLSILTSQAYIAFCEAQNL